MHPAVVIDPEIAALLTPHTTEELALLARSLREQGCREPLAVWPGSGILLDGHARHRICVEQGIAFDVTEIDLPDREAAVRFVLERQLGRRNLRPIAMCYYRGRLYLSIRKKAGRPKARPKSGQNAQVCTDAEVAARYGVDPRTTRRDAAFARDLDALALDMGDEFRSSVLSGEARLARKDIRTLAGMGRQERKRYVREKNLVRHPPPPTPLPAARGKLLERLTDLWRHADEGTRREFLSMPEVVSLLGEAACS
ncbi:MAG: hypothetical protein K2W96_04345 [Gemmataceae bacterium]|nr:hypothetical protein [Gemmataceae bacterium]